MQALTKQFSDQFQIVSMLFKFLQLTVFTHDKSSVILVAGYENLESMLLKATVAVENYQIRMEVLKRVKEIVQQRSQTSEMPAMLRIVKALVFNIQSATEAKEQRCLQYYEGLTQIIDSLTLTDIEGLKEPL